MPKSTKRVILSNEKLNTLGFWIKTSGIDLSRFLLNPVMYWLNNRPKGTNSKENFPIGYLDDLQVNGGELSGVPVFDDNDELAMSLYNKFEHGTLRAVDCNIEPTELSTEPADMVPGQTLPTYKKSLLHSVSLVDRGYNPDAVTLNISADTLTLLKQIAVNNKQQTVLTNNNPLDPDGNHSPETLAIVENALKVKKIDREFAGHLLGLGIHKTAIDTIKTAIQNTPIDPDKLQGHYHATILKDAVKPYYELKNRHRAEILSDMRDYAPDLYRAKYFEGNGKMPYEIDGKPC